MSETRRENNNKVFLALEENCRKVATEKELQGE
jgi:hypothetical protein